MDFEKVLRFLIEDFNREKISYALIGGFALAVFGIIRATTDIDFLVEKDDLPAVKRTMDVHSYTCSYESENVAQFTSDVKPFGSVDFLLAFRPVSRAMLKRSVEKNIFNGLLSLPVLLPEDIIGLKVQAQVNNQKREELEASDIEKIFELYAQEMDWTKLHDYFYLFNREKDFLRYEKRFRRGKDGPQQ